MGYFYDFHVHSSECSGCAASNIEEITRALKKAGYAGFVLTNHFLTGNNCIPDSYSWEEKVARYWETYLIGKQIGEEIDLDVFFGIEHHYGNAQEILIYGIDLDFLLKNPDMCDISAESLCERVHEYGGFVSHSHPFRERGYIPKGDFRMDLSYVDAIEVYNSANREIEDERAQALCKEQNLAYTAGNDLHFVRHLESFPHAGLEFDFRLKTDIVMLSALRNRLGRVRHTGERYFK